MQLENLDGKHGGQSSDVVEGLAYAAHNSNRESIGRQSQDESLAQLRLPPALRPSTEIPEQEAKSRPLSTLRPYRIKWDPLEVYLREACTHSVLSHQQELALFAKLRAGDEGAREELITSNLRFVVRLAKDFHIEGVSLLDLINNGNMGLMKAVDRFDPRRGPRFSTYAGWWIRKYLRDAVSSELRTIHIPPSQVTDLSLMNRTTEALINDLGRPPTALELSETTGISVRRIKILQAAAVRPSSLDEPLQPDKAETLGALIPDHTCQIPGTSVDCKEATERALAHISKLNPQEQAVIKRRFGLQGDRPETLEELSRDFSVTGERVRQIQAKALLKLRNLIMREASEYPEEETVVAARKRPYQRIRTR